MTTSICPVVIDHVPPCHSFNLSVAGRSDFVLRPDVEIIFTPVLLCVRLKRFLVFATLIISSDRGEALERLSITRIDLYIYIYIYIHRVTDPPVCTRRHF